MQLIKVKTNHEASSESIKFITDYIKKKDNKLNIAFTGGRFSKFFLTQLAATSLFNKKLRIFQTDERFVPTDHSESIQGMIMNNFKSRDNIENCFFDVTLTPENSASEMEKKINNFKLIGFDITTLSLGEDGHLAGNFPNSKDLGQRITYNIHAPKLPKERISFSINWLSKSSLIILFVIGPEKDNAFRDFISGNSQFPEIYNASDKIIVIKT